MINNQLKTILGTFLEQVWNSGDYSQIEKGELPQMPATGKTFVIHGMTIYYFDGNKLCGHTQAYDRLGFYQQMQA